MNTKNEPKNICKHCGSENTLWPKWIGRKRVYVCDTEISNGCGKISNGITKRQWAEKTGRMTPGDEKRAVELLQKIKEVSA